MFVGGMVVFFFKQKTAYEMRISDGVQTCALPILFKEKYVDFFGWKMNTLQTDYDTLFRDVQVQQWCIDNGITHQMSTPYVHAQSGLIERAIQSILDRKSVG